MTSLKFPGFLRDKSETPNVVSCFFNRLLAPKTRNEVVVYHADSLHVRITNCRADKLEFR